MQAMEVYLRELVQIEAAGAERLVVTFRFPADLQGPPETGHGGGVTAMLLELTRLFLFLGKQPALLDGPVSMEVSLHRALPLETPVRGEVSPSGDGWHSRVQLDARTIAEAEIRAGAAVALPAAVPGALPDPGADGPLVPAYEMCLGCGVRNPRGAQVRFQYDDVWMWRSLAPQAHFRCGDGRLLPGYLAIVCDELGWWLGALRQGECGVSNRIRLTLASTAYGAPLLALGPRGLVTTADPKGRIWQTQSFVLTSDGTPVAAAAVQFVGSPAFTRLMVPRFLALDDADAVRRAFPRAGRST